MASIINSTDTGSGGLITTGDSSDELQLQTAETTAITITSGQQSAFIAGTASAPAVTTTGDLNTGIYFPAADNIGFATGGTIRGRWTTDGLCFGTDTAAANALDDYEEGTWTPSYLPGAGSFTSVTYQDQAGGYTKIGNRVWFQGRIRTSAITVGSASGTLYIQGLPFTSINNSATGRNAGSISLCSGWGGDFPNALFVETNATFFVLLYRSSVNGATINMDVSDLGTGASANLLFFSGCYDV